MPTEKSLLLAGAFLLGAFIRRAGWRAHCRVTEAISPLKSASRFFLARRSCSRSVFLFAVPVTGITRSFPLPSSSRSSSAFAHEFATPVPPLPPFLLALFTCFRPGTSVPRLTVEVRRQFATRIIAPLADSMGVSRLACKVMGSCGIFLPPLGDRALASGLTDSGILQFIEVASSRH